MRCPHCGAKHQEDGFKCSECGTMIDRVMPKTTWKQVLIGAIFLIALGIAGFAFIFINSNDTTGEPQSFNDYSWEELATIASDMTLAGNVDGAMREAKKHGFVADDGSLRDDLVKEFQLTDGTTVQAQLVGVSHDPRSNNSGNAGMSFIVSAPMAELSMNASATNAGGWEASELREKLKSDLFASLPADLQNYIVEVKKQTNNIGRTDSVDAVTTTFEKLFPLSHVELMGVSEGDQGFTEVLNAEGSQYALLSNAGFRSNLLNTIADEKSLNWWLRSPNPENDTQFYSARCGYDTEESDPLAMNANDRLSVVCGFCI